MTRFGVGRGTCAEVRPGVGDHGRSRDRRGRAATPYDYADPSISASRSITTWPSSGPPPGSSTDATARCR